MLPPPGPDLVLRPLPRGRGWGVWFAKKSRTRSLGTKPPLPNVGSGSDGCL